MLLENQKNHSYSYGVTFKTETPHKWCENKAHKSRYADTHPLFFVEVVVVVAVAVVVVFMWNGYRCACFSFGFRCLFFVCMHNQCNFLFSWAIVLCWLGFFVQFLSLTNKITAQILKFKCNVPIFLSALFVSLNHSISFTHSFCRVCVWMLRNSSVCNPFEFPISLQHKPLHVLLPPFDMWKCTHTLSYIVIWSGI